MVEQGDQIWPTDIFARLVPYEAAKIGSLIADETAWVERRVESVSFVDETTQRRHVSVHFEVPHFEQTPGTPAGVALMFVPLAFLKKEVLRNLDVRDETGRALPVLSRRQNAALAAQVLVDQAIEVLEVDTESELQPAVRWLLRTAAGLHDGPEPPQTQTAAEQISQLESDETMIGYLADLGQSFMLLARVDAAPGQTRIVKFSYEYDFDEEQPEARTAAGLKLVLAVSAEPFVRLATALGLADYKTWFGTPGMFDAQSYHVEVACPDEITIAEAVLFRVEGETHKPVSDDQRADRAHLSVHSPHPDDARDGYVVVRYCLRAALIIPVAVLTALTAGVITGGLALHYWFPGAQRTDTSAALVVAIPTFFAAFVVPGSHRLVRRMFVGLRVVALLSGLCSFAAAATLALQLSPDAVAHIWIGLAATAGTLAVAALLALCHSWWRTRAPRRRRHRLVVFLLVALVLAPVADTFGDRGILTPARGQWLWSALAWGLFAVVLAVEGLLVYTSAPERSTSER